MLAWVSDSSVRVGSGMLPKVRKIVQHMRANLDQSLSLDDLARLTGLSKSRTSELFRMETGTSPGQYLTMLRMEKARELLETTSLSIAQIRARIGMRDESHFVRVFKKTFNITPSKYRLTAQKIKEERTG